MGEFDGDAAEIVPDPARICSISAARFVREGGGQIGAADAVLREPRADVRMKPPTKSAMRLRLVGADRSQHADRERPSAASAAP